MGRVAETGNSRADQHRRTIRSKANLAPAKRAGMVPFLVHFSIQTPHGSAGRFTASILPERGSFGILARSTAGKLLKDRTGVFRTNLPQRMREEDRT